MKRILVSIFMLLFTLVSCGKNEQSTVSNDKKLKEITIVLDWTPNTNHTGLYVAKDKGYFEKEGLKVNIVQPAEDSSSVIVGSGRAQFGIYFQPNMIKRLVKNVPITAVAAIIQNNTAGIMTLSKTAKTPEELSGKKYFTWEDKIDDATVKNLVKGKIVPVPGETTNPIGGLESGLFDYLLVYYGWEEIEAELQNVKTNFFFLKDYNKAFNYYSPVIIANNDFLKNEPDVARKALKAIKEGYEFAVKNPEESANILIKYAPETNKKLIIASQKWISKQYIGNAKSWGIFDISRWDRFNKWVFDQKLISTPLKSGEGVTNDYLK